MSFYLRKSIKLGPLRFNLSGSGIGVSGGVKGFRVGTGPRGNYVHMGRQGLYYRSTLPAGSYTQSQLSSPTSRPENIQPQVPDGLTEIESGSVEVMTNSTSDELLKEIASKHRLIHLWIPAISFGGFAWLLLAVLLPLWASSIFLLALIILTVWLARRDTIRKTTILMYELDPSKEAAYHSFHNGFDWLATANRAWHLVAQGATADWKRNAGAGTLIKRQPLSFRKEDPPYLKTNIAVPRLQVGRQTLYFFPDRILVYAGGNVGAVGYEELSLKISESRFIEDQAVPSDSKVVDHTWRYVNKKGGPDRRFNNNRELPILLYGEIRFTSGSGLNEVIQISNTNAPVHFLTGVKSLVAALNDKPDKTPSATSQGAVVIQVDDGTH